MAIYQGGCEPSHCRLCFVLTPVPHSYGHANGTDTPRNLTAEPGRADTTCRATRKHAPFVKARSTARTVAGEASSHRSVGTSDLGLVVGGHTPGPNASVVDDINVDTKQHIEIPRSRGEELSTAKSWHTRPRPSRSRHSAGAEESTAGDLRRPARRAGQPTPERVRAERCGSVAPSSRPGRRA